MKIKFGALQAAALLSAAIAILMRAKLLSLAHYALVLVLPAFLLTFALPYDDLTFLERLLAAFSIFILFIIPLQALSFIGVGVSPLIILLVCVVLPILIAIPSRKKIFAFASSLRESRPTFSSDLVPVLLLLLAVFLIWSPLLNPTAIPRTASTGYYVYASEMKNDILSHGKIPLWDAAQNLGWPILTFENTGYYHLLVSTDLLTPGTTLNADFSFTFWLAMLAAGLGVYALCRRLKLSNFESILPAILFLSIPRLATIGVFTGYSKTFAAFFPIPLAVAMLILAFEKPRYYLLMSMLLVASFLVHPQVAIWAILFIAACFVVERLANWRLPSKQEIAWIGAAAGAFFMLTAYWLLPLFAAMPYRSTETYPVPAVNTVLGQLFSEPVRDLDWNIGRLFTIAAVAGSVSLLFRNAKKNLKHLLIPAAILLLFAAYYLPGPSKFLQELVDMDKLVVFASMAFAISAAGLFAVSDDRRIKAGAAVALLLLCGWYGAITHWRAADWYSEQAQNGFSPAEVEFLKAAPPGRTITFGVYGTVIDQQLPLFTGKPSIGHAAPMEQHTDIFYKKLYYEGARSVPENTNLNYWLNIFRQSWGRHLWIAACYPGGSESFEFFRESELTPVYSDNQCMVILEADPGGFAEKVTLARTSLDEKALYALPGAWKFIGLKDNSDGVPVNSEADMASLPEPEPLQFTRPDDETIEIDGPFSNDWIFIKEEFFPRWNAYLDGRSVQIKMSNLGMMLVKADSGSKLVLKNEPYGYEIALSVLATLTLILLFAENYLKKGKPAAEA